MHVASNETSMVEHPAFTHLLDAEPASKDARRDATCRGKEGDRNPCTFVRSDVSDSCSVARMAIARDNMTNSPLGQRTQTECKAEGCQSLVRALSAAEQSFLRHLWYHIAFHGVCTLFGSVFLNVKRETGETVETVQRATGNGKSENLKLSRLDATTVVRR